MNIAPARMKRTMLQLHKEVALLCEEGMTLVEGQSALSVPHISKFVITVKHYTKT
jgi:hypothetical protein